MIYTFYSYKGGVGRSMALANVAECLYRRGARVLMIDWDLEAPGLEHFFCDTQARLDDVRSQLGVIDMLLDYKRRYRQALPAPLGETEEEGTVGDAPRSTRTSIFESLKPNLLSLESLLYPIHPPQPRGDKTSKALWLLPAGWRSTGGLPVGSGGNETQKKDDRFSKYAEAVQSFDWADFYARFEGEAYFNWLREQVLPMSSSSAASHSESSGRLGVDAVLIDSRTGVTEMGGVCTRQLADVVVSFSAPNYQNLEGVIRMTQSFLRDDVRAFRGGRLPEVVVVPARVDVVAETDETNRFRTRFNDDLKKQLEEQQVLSPTFERFDQKMWDLLIPYIAKYSFRESLTVGAPDSNETLEAAYTRLTAHLALFAEPQSNLRTYFAPELLQFARSTGVDALEEGPSLAQELVLRASSVFAGLNVEEQSTARSLLTRLVRVAPEASGDSRLRVKAGDLGTGSRTVVLSLVDARVLKLRKDDHTGEELVEIGHDALLNDWEPLRGWLNEDREFLLWRQALDSQRISWELKGRNVDLLLRDSALAGAGQWSRIRPADLSPPEREYIEESYKAERAAQVAEEERRKRDIQAERAKQVAEEERLEREQEDRTRQAAEQERLRQEQAERAKQLAAEELARRELEARARAATRRRQMILAMASVIAFLALASAWIAWIYSDTYQIRIILKDAPVSNAASNANGDAAVIAWAQALALSGRIDNALAAARQVDDTQRESGLARVAQVLGQASMDDASTRFWNDALAAAHQIVDSYGRAYALAAVGQSLAQAGKPDDAQKTLNDALAAAGQVSDPNRREAAIADVAKSLAKAGKVDDALTAARQIVKPTIFGQPSAPDAVAKVLAQAGRDKDALAAARQIGDSYQRARALAAVALSLAKAGKADDAPKALADALAAARQVSDSHQRTSALFDVAVALARAGEVDGALAAARQIVDPYQRATVLAAVALSLAQTGKPDDALAAARQIDDPSQRATALAAVAPSLAQAGEVDGALAAARQIDDPNQRVNALAAVALSLAQAGKPDDALAAARQIDDPNQRVNALAAVALSLAQAGKPDDALAAARQLKDPYFRAKALTSVAKLMIQAGKVSDAKQITSQALEFARQIPNDTDRSSALADVAQVEALLHSYRQARLLVDPCLSVDKLSAYAAILTEYTKQRNPAPRESA